MKLIEETPAVCGRTPGELAAPHVEGRAIAGQPGVHRRAAHLDGVYRNLAGQLWLRPTSLERRGGTLVYEHLGAELHRAAGQVGEGRFEADQRSDGERAGVQYLLRAAAPPVLGDHGQPGDDERHVVQHVVDGKHATAHRVTGGAADQRVHGDLQYLEGEGHHAHAAHQHHQRREQAADVGRGGGRQERGRHQYTGGYQRANGGAASVPANAASPVAASTTPYPEICRR